MDIARYYAVGAFEPRPFRSLGPGGIASLAIAVAAFCALAVFLWLCQRDNSFLLQTIQSELRPQAAHNASSTPGTASPALTAATKPVENEPSYARSLPAPKRVPFTIRQSRRLQRFGDIRLGLWRTDAKRKLCDLSIVVQGHRINFKGIGPNQLLKIDTGRDTEPLQLLVNRMTSNQVSGYFIDPVH